MGAVTMHDWRVVAALYAGLFWNAGFLYLSGFAWFWVPGLLDVALLAAGFFLVGARAPLQDSVAERFGPPVASLFCRVLMPLWLTAWLGSNLAVAAECLGTRVAAALFAMAMLLVANDAARGAWFRTRVSIAIALGPFIGVAALLPEVTDWPGLRLVDAPASPLLIWAAPALLLSGYVPTEHPRKVALWGVAVAMGAACFIGMAIMAGAGEGNMRFAKVPDLFAYVAGRGKLFQRVQLAILALTLITAIRFATQFARMLTPAAIAHRLPRWLFAALLCLAALTVLSTRWTWHNHSAATLLAIPFVPLAGVLSVRGPVPRWSAYVAWVAGFVLTWAPLSMREFELEQPAVWPGWALAFGVTYTASFVHRRLMQSSGA